MKSSVPEGGRMAGSTEGADLLVLGYGNEMRGDDGVGPAVAEAVEALGLEGVRARSCHQLTPERSREVADADVVVFVDAVVGRGARGVELREVEASEAAGIEWIGHGMTPEALVALARDLYGRCPRSWFVGIPVHAFGWGPGLSLAGRVGVAAGVEAVQEVRRTCMKPAS